MTGKCPIIAICGFGGSGKTTLLEQLIGRLRAGGLTVAAVKHNVRSLSVDQPGKDSDRLFRAGADVLLRSPDEELLRVHADGDDDLETAVASLAPRYDLILVEGHKKTPLPKLWMLNDDETAPPEDVTNIQGVFAKDAGRFDAIVPVVDEMLRAQWSATPVFGCVLIGGKSTRMGQPKHLLVSNGLTWLERTVKLLGETCQTVAIAGAGDVPTALADCPRLPDVVGVAGPMAGVLSAMRWQPTASWLVVACDLPNVNAEAIDWLLSVRRPGVWATLPTLRGESDVEPLLAHYDRRARPLLERLAAAETFGLHRIASHVKVDSPVVPPHLAAAWRNVNSPEDLPSR